MPKFSEASQSKLATCDRRLHHVLYAAIGFTDFSVICGYRGEKSQLKAFESGKSKVQWPNSKHNQKPSLAVDIAPYPIDWEDKERFCYLAGVIMTTAKLFEVPLKWGGDWGWDFGHFELREIE
jgi:hypothetical protein